MVRVRFAPSPTGYVHIGSLRTALYNYLYSKNQKGSYILRIEDTDQTRYVEGSIENLMECMTETGIIHDEGPIIKNGKLGEQGDFGPYTQSKRLDIYKEYMQELLDGGWAYYCFCSSERLDEVREKQRAAGETPRYDGYCRDLSKEEVEEKISNGEPYVIRLRLTENTIISFNDIVRGCIDINTNDLDDQVLIKSDGFPTYHFAVVVDDHLMKITHVIRGEEWLSSTPKHVALYKAFGWEEPTYVHLSNILNDDKKKLSKRQGDVAVEDFLRKGYLPEALVNYIALLGWSPEGEEEIFTLEELTEAFNLDRINSSGAVFDRNKLKWMNGNYIRNMDIKELVSISKPYLLKNAHISESDFQMKPDHIEMIVETLREKVDTLEDFNPLIDQLFNDEFTFDDKMKEVLQGETVPILVEVAKSEIELLEELNIENIKAIFKKLQKEHKIKGKNLYMPMRIILTGEMHGADLMASMCILGKEKLLERLNKYSD